MIGQHSPPPGDREPDRRAARAHACPDRRRTSSPPKAALASAIDAPAAIDEAFLALELAHAAAVAEQERLQNREINLASILIRLHREHPESSAPASRRSCSGSRRILGWARSFLACLNEAVEDGLAVRRGHDDVRITYAGVQQLLAAKRLRADLERVAPEHFQTGTAPRAAERATMTDESLTPTQPRKAAVGA
jgi:hypothetical protein